MVWGVLRFLLSLTAFFMVTAWIRLCTSNDPSEGNFRIVAGLLFLFILLLLAVLFIS